MKICSMCKQNLPLTDFYLDKKGEHGRISMCKPCHKVRSKISYAKNRVKRIASARERIGKSRAFVRRLKKDLKCNRCDENHPATLQFHHIDPTKKEIAISTAVKNGLSESSILREIEKCEVLCANCHSKEHWTED
jgi:hypothetical protein